MNTFAFWMTMLVQALLVGTVVGTTNLQRADAFDAVEEALLSSKSNLYLLKETFLSSSRSLPTLLIVTYEVATTNSSYQQSFRGSNLAKTLVNTMI